MEEKGDNGLDKDEALTIFLHVCLGVKHMHDCEKPSTQLNPDTIYLVHKKDDFVLHKLLDF